MIESKKEHHHHHQQQQQQQQQRTLYYPNIKSFGYKKDNSVKQKIAKFAHNNLKANRAEWN